MSEVYAKISDMRRASEQLRTTSQRIDRSVTSASDAIDGLFLLGLNDPSLQTRYLLLRERMADFSGTLSRFADELGDAAETIDAATRGTRFSYTLGRRPSRDLSMLRRPDSEPVSVQVAVEGETTLNPFAYLAAHNEPLYERWQSRNEVLETHKTNLAALVSTRETRLADLEALRNRLHSYDATLDIERIPRVEALVTEIETLDAQISDLTTTIDTHQAELDRLTHRLNLLTPGEGADLDLIASMEGTESPFYLRENTFDCVNHIVNKFHVPPNIARDAHLWIEKAAEFSEYGVTVGEIPLEGSVLWMDMDHPYSDPQYGHVMYVEEVIDGEVWITDNNNPEPIQLSEVVGDRTDGIRYLYFPWHTVG
ncbi:MAG: CHAP domain-containing protein [Chloroflexota bacterium]